MVVECLAFSGIIASIWFNVSSWCIFRAEKEGGESTSGEERGDMNAFKGTRNPNLNIDLNVPLTKPEKIGLL